MIDPLLSRILDHSGTAARKIVAIAGPPGSGKSTLARQLADALTTGGHPAQVVPMDGFHLDNRILEERDMLGRKGAPETFDLRGFKRLLMRLQEPEDLYFPVFDRAQDIAISGAGMIGADCEFVIVEGNYLLLDEPDWRDLSQQWDLSVWLKVNMAELSERVVKRWLDHGFSQKDAQLRAEHNDLPNARRAKAAMMPHDLEL